MARVIIDVDDDAADLLIEELERASFVRKVAKEAASVTASRERHERFMNIDSYVEVRHG